MYSIFISLKNSQNNLVSSCIGGKREWCDYADGSSIGSSNSSSLGHMGKNKSSKGDIGSLDQV